MPSPFALYDNAALRALEHRASAIDGFDETTLMQRAGAAAWRCLLQHWPSARRIVVLCGPGNNGGDGWVLAKHALDSGLDVAVVQLDAPRSPLCISMADAYRQAGGHINHFEDALPEADVIVDALFGIGLDRAPQGDAARLIEAANASDAPILALDTPSGVDAEHGAVPGVAIIATHTLQFIAAHMGLATGAAIDHAGALSLATLDLPDSCFEEIVPVAETMPTPRLPRRARDSHKGRFGHVLALGGDAGMGGAIALASEAALRCGAGRVSVATRAMHVPMLLARRPEAMAHAVENATSAFPLIDHADALAIGPGLGQGDWGRALFDAVIRADKPMVLDADALNLLAMSPRPLPHAVLTPHPGEAARLLGTTIDGIQRDRRADAEALASAFQCAVVLKGAGSLIAAPGRTTRVIALGNPGMASGGMGDALTGIVAALLAQGHEPFEAASLGAWLHARAGDRAAIAGEAGLLASDLIDQLRATIAACSA